MSKLRRALLLVAALACLAGLLYPPRYYTGVGYETSVARYRLCRYWVMVAASTGVLWLILPRKL